MTPDLGIEPGPHWWEASALTTAPSLQVIIGMIIIRLRFALDDTLILCRINSHSWLTVHERKVCQCIFLAMVRKPYVRGQFIVPYLQCHEVLVTDYCQRFRSPCSPSLHCQQKTW